MIPGTEGIEPGPGVQLDHRELEFAQFIFSDLANANLAGTNLANARVEFTSLEGANMSEANLTNLRLWGVTLTGANLSGALITGMSVENSTIVSQPQFRSTASYQARNLRGIVLAEHDLSGWDFSGQDLTNAKVVGSDLTGTNFSGATVVGATLRFATQHGFTKEQLYSTASYRAKDLQGIQFGLGRHWLPSIIGEMAGWDFSSQNLTHADLSMTNLQDANLSGSNLTATRFSAANLTNADLSGAMVVAADFGGSSGLTASQLYSTVDYQSRNLRQIGLARLDLSGWDFGGQNLEGARLNEARLVGTDLSEANVWGIGLGGDGRLQEDGVTKEQLYSTKSYKDKLLGPINLNYIDLSGWDFERQYLVNSSYQGVVTVDTSFDGADLRGATLGALDSLAGASMLNAIRFDGSIDGLSVHDGETMLVRDDSYGTGREPIAITILRRMSVDPSSRLHLTFESDPWDSLISFEPGIPVELGGTLELMFKDDVDVATQLGRTLHIFDWTGVDPTGAFTVASPYLWDLTNLYSTGEVRLTGTGGDFDGSGIVDQADLDFVLQNWGNDTSTPPIGWTNDLPTGLIDQAELDRVLLNWGRTAMLAGGANVPEPATWITLLLSAVAIASACPSIGRPFPGSFARPH